MLVLSRKLNEQVIIDGAVRITILGISKNKVKLGIVAPKEVPVHREEIFELICNTKGEKSQGGREK